MDNPKLNERYQTQNNSECFTHVKGNNISDGSYVGDRYMNISLDPEFEFTAQSDFVSTRGIAQCLPCERIIFPDGIMGTIAYPEPPQVPYNEEWENLWENRGDKKIWWKQKNVKGGSGK